MDPRQANTSESSKEQRIVLTFTKRKVIKFVSTHVAMIPIKVVFALTMAIRIARNTDAPSLIAVARLAVWKTVKSWTALVAYSSRVSGQAVALSRRVADTRA